MPTEELAVKKTPLPMGAKGVQLESFEALWRFAQCVASSPFAPRGMEKPEAIVTAIQLGLEIGLSPMSALQNVAVINGRPGIYGDAALALVSASGRCEYYTQSEPTGEGDARTVTVVSKRDDSPEPITSSFSIADAKKAGLWGKQGPWSQYPDRMLLFRARGFNLRDNFGDILKGLHTVEELADQSIRTVEGRVVNGNGIQFGPAIPEETREATRAALESSAEPISPENVVSGADLDNNQSQPSEIGAETVSAEPPRRKRRSDAGKKRSLPETTPAANPEHAGAQAETAAGQTPQRATPLEGLRNLINATPITEFQLEQYLIKKGMIEPHQHLEQINGQDMQSVIEGFHAIANSIADGTA